MQQREQRILKKLAEAREAQANAMSRFIQARARVMEVETRLQALHARLAIPSTAPDQPAENTQPPAELVANIQKPDATPAAQVIIPSVNAFPTPTEVARPLTSTSPTTTSLAEQARASLPQPPQATGSAVTDAEIPTSAPLEAMPTLADDDDDETQKVPAFRPTRPTSPVQHNPDEEETLIVTRSELVSKEQPASDNAVLKANTSDRAEKLPVMRQERDQTQESL